MRKWNHQDWLWLLVFILFSCGTAFMYKQEVMNLISYGSTFVSISLAFIAIFISVREATKSDKLKDDTLVILAELRERMGQIDSKVSNLDLPAINQKIVKGIDEGIEGIKLELIQELEKIQTTFGEQGENHLIENILDEKLNSLSTDLKSSLIVRKPTENYIEQEKRVYLPSLDEALRNYYSVISKDTKITARSARDGILKLTGNGYPMAIMNNFFKSHVAKGILEEIPGEKVATYILNQNT